MFGKTNALPAAMVGLALIVAGLSPTRIYADPLLYDNFDSYTTGEPPVLPWEEIYLGPGSTPISRGEAAALGVTITIDGSVSVSGKSVHFLDTASTVAGFLTQSLTPSSHVVLEYYMRSHNADYEGTFVKLAQYDDVAEDYIGYDYGVAFGAEAGGGQAGYIGIISGAGWPKPDLLAYSTDTWYYVRRELDVATNTGTFYVQEAANPANSATISLGYDYAMSEINRLWLNTSGSQGADCYIDEISVNYVPEPFSMAFLGSAFVGVVVVGVRRRRRARQN